MRRATTMLHASAPCSEAPCNVARQAALDPARRHGPAEMRTKHTFRLPPDLAGKLADYAARKRVSRPRRRGRARLAIYRRTAPIDWRRHWRGGSIVSRGRSSGWSAMSRSPTRRWRCSCASGSRARRLCPTPPCRRPRPRGASATRALSRRWAEGCAGQHACRRSHVGRRCRTIAEERSGRAS